MRLLDILHPYLCLEDSLKDGIYIDYLIIDVDEVLNQEKALQLFNLGLHRIGVANRFQLTTSEIERGSVSRTVVF